jgi:hypothetical protein
MDTASSAFHDLEAMEMRSARYAKLRQRGIGKDFAAQNGGQSSWTVASGE